MALTSSDLDALDRAIASGELTIRTATGHQVTYRDIDQLIKARTLVAAQVAAATTGSRPYPRHQLADFRDD